MLYDQTWFHRIRWMILRRAPPWAGVVFFASDELKREPLSLLSPRPSSLGFVDPRPVGAQGEVGGSRALVNA